MNAVNAIAAGLLGVAVTTLPAGASPQGNAPANVRAIADGFAAAPVGVGGYVWANQSGAAQYVANTGYEYSSAGEPITITRYAPGSYRVRFAGLGADGGVAHVSPYGFGNTSICTVTFWSRSGSDELVYVRCFDATGEPADSRFVANFTARTATAAEFLTYFRSHWVSAVAQAPPATWRYDSYGQPPQLWRESTGRYVITDDSFDAAAPGLIDGHVQITAIDAAPVRCRLGDDQNEGAFPIAKYIDCVDADGDPVDARFSYTFVRGADVLGANPAAFGNAWYNPAGGGDVGGWWSTGGQPVAVELATGRYRVAFPGLGVGHGHAIADAQGPDAACHVASWHSTGGDLYVYVDCFHTVTGQPVNTWFGVAYTR